MYNLIFTNKNGRIIDFTLLEDTQILNVSGLDPTQAEISEMTTPNRDGVYFSNIKRGKRVITVSLAQIGRAEINRRVRSVLYSVCGPKTAGSLRFTDDSLDVSVSAVVESVVPAQWSEKPTVIITIVCDSALFESTETKKSNIYTSKGLFKFPLVLNAAGEPVGEVMTDTQLVITNNGQEKAPCLISLRLTGSVENPVVYNNTTGEYFSIEGNFTTGQVLEFYSGVGGKYAKCINSDASETDIFHKISVASSWLLLEVGNNNFTIGAISGVNNIMFSLEYKELYYGVD